VNDSHQEGDGLSWVASGFDGEDDGSVPGVTTNSMNHQGSDVPLPPQSSRLLRTPFLFRSDDKGDRLL
ncbi:hypothetical protein HAX54_041646, partial [Datura stramonium]|nr:hypothetical protein [Datura stramonium]